jgi:tagatose 1,6-diphosphate aldolase
MQLTPGKLLGMRRLADEKGLFKMVAADQRPPITGPIAKQLGVAEAPWDEVAKFKAQIVTQLQGASSAILLDPYYGIPAAFDKLASDKGLIVTLEDSVFSESTAGRFSKDIDHWTVNKIKRLGGDAVKVLVWYRPDASPENIVFQQDYVKRIGEECQHFDIPFLLELLLYPFAVEADKSTGYIEMKEKNSDFVLASIEEFAKQEYGVDLFKLESPVNANMINSSGNVQELFDEMGRLAGRPWVMLSAGAGKENFQNVLLHAFQAGASGFLAGRAIWQDSFSAYPDWQKIIDGLSSDGFQYLQQISKLADKKAMSWTLHQCYGDGGAALSPQDFSFTQNYDSI